MSSRILIDQCFLFAQARSQARSLPARAPASDFVRVRLGIRVHQEEDDGPAAEQGNLVFFLSSLAGCGGIFEFLAVISSCSSFHSSVCFCLSSEIFHLG